MEDPTSVSTIRPHVTSPINPLGRLTEGTFGHTAPQFELQNTFSRLFSMVCLL